ELNLEAIETVVRDLDGHDVALTKFRYGIPGFDLLVWADETGKVYLIDVPSQSAAWVRDGYEALRAGPPVDPLVSAPEFEVIVERGVPVPMRDGISLSTDIYRPAGVERAPVILVRSPYKKELAELQARFFARRGYVFAAQDCRGCFESGGAWEPFLNEGAD